MLTKITADIVKNDWNACYSAEKVDALFPVARTPLEILTLKEGPWESVPPQDRLWAVCRDDVLPEQLVRLFACWCAEKVLPFFERVRTNDDRPRKAIEVARRYTYGEATAEERVAAWDSAWDAACAAAGDAVRASVRDAARSAARAAACAAAGGAVWDSAWVAAGDAAYATAGDAARGAARDAAGDAQIEKLANMVRIWSETGDVYGGERKEDQ